MPPDLNALLHKNKTRLLGLGQRIRSKWARAERARACLEQALLFTRRCLTRGGALLQRGGRACRARWPGIQDRLRQYARLIRLDRPIGILLLLWPTLWALWLAAAGPPDLHI